MQFESMKNSTDLIVKESVQTEPSSFKKNGIWIMIRER